MIGELQGVGGTHLMFCTLMASASCTVYQQAPDSSEKYTSSVGPVV